MTIKVKVGQSKNIRLVAAGEKRPVIVPDSITLGIDTVGDYVARIDGGQGIVITPENDIETANLVISHAATSSEVSTNNSLLEFIRNADIDQFGHLTGFENTALDPVNFYSNNNLISSKDIRIGDTIVNLGSITTELSGLTNIQVGDLTLEAGSISSNGDIRLVPGGANSVVDLDFARITNLEDPINPYDAVNKRHLDVELDRVETTIKVFDDPINPTDATNKRYVDNLVQGLVVRAAALAATTQDLGGTFQTGNTSYSATITVPPTQFLYIDDVTTWTLGANLLVKDQNNPEENGSYELIQQGDSVTPWVFQRHEWSNDPSEIPGSFEFVTDGTVNGGTGWVATVNDAPTYRVDIDPVYWSQFSGEGTYTPGQGLSLTGRVFSVNQSQIIDTIVPSNDVLTVTATGALTLPIGPSASRPTPVTGMIRFNSQDNQFEGFDGIAWSGLGGVIDVNQDTRITAEDSPGSNNDELKFYTGGVLAAKIDANTANFYGDVNIAGHITIGDLPTDSITVIADFTSDLKPDEDRTYNLGTNDANWNILYVDTIKSSDQIVNFDTTGAIKLPAANTALRPVAEAGMLRYNTEDQRFEGYDGIQWAGLAGSVVDLDRNTYIIAETSTGADNNELDFYTAGVQRAQIDSLGSFRYGLNLDKLIIDYNTGNLIVNSKITSESDLIIDPVGIIDVANNTISGVADPVNPTDAVNLRYLDNTFSSGLTIIDGANTYTDGVDLLKNPTIELGDGLELEAIDSANNTFKIGLDKPGNIVAGIYGNDRYMPRIRINEEGRIDFATEIPVELQANAIPDFTETSRDIIGLMFTDAQANGANEGVSVYHDDPNDMIYIIADNFDITLTGDVSGTATVNRLSDTEINVSFTTEFVSQITPLGANSGIIITETPVANTAAKIDQISIDHDYLSTKYQQIGTGIWGDVDYVAKRFVDSDNTNFYVDPAGISRINEVEVGFGSTFSRIKMRDGPGSWSYIYGSGGKIGFLDNTFNYAAYSERATGDWVVQNGDVRAERFVDADALSYFLHPGGTDSYLKQITVQDKVTASEIQIGGDVGVRTIRTNTGALTINASGGIVLNGNGNDLDINNVKIVNLANPDNPQDAATKSYVDGVAQGLRVIPAALAATTADLGAIYNNGAGTLTASVNEAFTLDGVTSWSVGDRVLVKDQTNALQNGAYEVTVVGNGTTPWVLTRGQYFNETSEIPGAFQFVTDGTINRGTGWVAGVDDAESFILGVDTVTWYQFSGAGTYTAGEALTLNGTEFSISDGAIENVKLANPQITINDEFGANTVIALGEALTIEGTDGVDTTVTSGKISIAVNVLDGGTF